MLLPLQHTIPALHAVPHVEVPSAPQVALLVGSMHSPVQHAAVHAIEGDVQLVPPVHVCVPGSHVPPPQSAHAAPQWFWSSS